MLTKRLAACAELVSGKGIACDVGTDHAYLAAELLRNGTCREVIASDVAEGPLQAAERTLRQAGLLSKAQLILSDGLMQVPSDGVTDVIIAGMGGETIIHILEDCPWIKGGVNLILQPMTKASLLREWLCGKGLDIHEERIVSEGKFFYTVIKAMFSGKKYTLSDFEKELGRPDWSDETVKEYGRFRLSHYRKLSQQMSAALPEAAEYYGKLAEELAGKCSEEEDT